MLYHWHEHIALCARTGPRRNIRKQRETANAAAVFADAMAPEFEDFCGEDITDGCKFHGRTAKTAGTAVREGPVRQSRRAPTRVEKSRNPSHAEIARRRIRCPDSQGRRAGARRQYDRVAPVSRPAVGAAPRPLGA